MELSASEVLTSEISMLNNFPFMFPTFRSRSFLSNQGRVVLVYILGFLLVPAMLFPKFEFIIIKFL